MPNSKTNKKRKNKVIAYSNNVKARQKKFRTEFIKNLQESHNREMESKVKDAQSTENIVDGLNEFALDDSPMEAVVVDNTQDLTDFSMDNLPIVEQTSPSPDVTGSLTGPK